MGADFVEIKMTPMLRSTDDCHYATNKQISIVIVAIRREQNNKFFFLVQLIFTTFHFVLFDVCFIWLLIV